MTEQNQVLGPESPSPNHGDFTVIDVLEPGNGNELAALQAYLRDLAGQKTGERLIRNYHPDRFVLDDQIAIPVVFHVPTGQIFGFSSIFRPAHWPQGTARVGNRTWVSRNFRVNGVNAMAKRDSIRAAVTFIQLVFQVNFDICRRAKISLPIITRESKGDMISALPKLARLINNDRLIWHADTAGYYQTVPNGRSRDCWQKIIYGEMEPGARRLLSGINRMTGDVFAHRFSATDH